MEISHRAKDFQPVVDEAEALFKELLNIPEGYSVLFLGCLLYTSLGICSALAVSAKLEPAIVMGLSVTVITAFANVVISLLRDVYKRQ